MGSPNCALPHSAPRADPCGTMGFWLGTLVSRGVSALAGAAEYVHGNKLTMDWVPMHDLDVQVFFIFQIFITLGVNWFSPPGNKG